MDLIIGFAIILGLIVIGSLIPRGASYEIWPHWHRLKRSADNDGSKAADVNQ
jgi:hypothetical protein